MKALNPYLPLFKAFISSLECVYETRLFNSYYFIYQLQAIFGAMSVKTDTTKKL